MGENGLYILLCAILVVILSVCVVLAHRCMRLMKSNFALRDSIENLSRFNDRLRADRHDYLNHLQVVYGLMELGEYDEMEKYLRKVYKELLKTGKAIKTSKPAINALLAAKSAEAESMGIEFIIEVKSDLRGLRIEDWELCKVLSNLTDNAIKALENSDREEKQLVISINETPMNYSFEITDNGPPIPQEIREKIFKRGFSTKKEEGHGLGLAIVSDILAENKGSIGLISDPEETKFTVLFEKEKE
ncbi:MAG: Spo0B domain-containing protein [Lachnospiraceae bacterium]|nr:Spo0B domain-containing protein [Lachnospiraceae bacterium]